MEKLFVKKSLISLALSFLVLLVLYFDSSEASIKAANESKLFFPPYSFYFTALYILAFSQMYFCHEHIHPGRMFRDMPFLLLSYLLCFQWQTLFIFLKHEGHSTALFEGVIVTFIFPFIVWALLSFIERIFRPAKSLATA